MATELELEARIDGKHWETNGGESCGVLYNPKLAQERSSDVGTPEIVSH